MNSSDLAALATLDALLQTASVSEAARRLGLSTPAVSHALARLRERFDDPLLVRAGRRMVLTPRAAGLREQVHEALTLAGRVFEPPQSFDPERLERSFALSVTDYVLVVLGPAIEALVRDRAPRLALRFIPNALDDAEKLRLGETDLAIGIYGELPPELRTRPLLTDRLVCVVRAGHPIVGKRLGLDQFVALDHVQVAPRGQPGGYVDQQLAERGHARRVVRAVPYFQVALSLTASSDYILTISERIARALGPSLGLTILEPPLPLEPYALSLVWHPRFDRDPAHAWLRELLLAATGEPALRPGARRRLATADPTTGQRRKRARRA